MRGDGAKEPFRHAKSGSFYPVSFLPSTRKILGPAQRPHLLGRNKSNGRDTFFLFPILSFSCKRKNGRRKKAPSKDASLCWRAALRREVRPLVSQRGLPGENRQVRAVREAGPYEQGGTPYVFLVAAGDRKGRPYKKIRRHPMNVGEGLAPPGKTARSFFVVISRSRRAAGRPDGRA